MKVYKIRYIYTYEMNAAAVSQRGTRFEQLFI